MRIILCVVILTSCLCPYTQAQTTLEKTLTLDGLQREYLIRLPKNYSSSQHLPIIFALHGGGGTYKNTMGLYNFTDVADQYGFIMLYPNAINKSWSMKGISSRVKGNRQDIDDVHFISVLIDTMVARYKGDEKRVFCTGISRGGIFSLYLAGRLSDRITAIAPVCASIPSSIAGDYTFTHPTPVLLMNGTADPLISYTGGPGKYQRNKDDEEQYDMLPTEELVSKIANLNKCNSNPVTETIPNSNTQDGCTATRYTYQSNTAPVIFIKIQGGGHTWPGGKQYLPKFLIGSVCKDFKAEEVICRFFSEAKPLK